MTKEEQALSEARRGVKPTMIRMSQNAGYDRDLKQTVWFGAEHVKPHGALMYRDWAQMPAMQ